MKITKQCSDGLIVNTFQLDNEQVHNVIYMCYSETNGKPFVIVRKGKDGNTDYAVESIATITDDYFSTVDVNEHSFTSTESTKLLEEKLQKLEQHYQETKNIKHSFTKNLPSYDISAISSAINLKENTVTTSYSTLFSLDTQTKLSNKEKELILLKFNNEVIASMSTSFFASSYAEKVLTNALQTFENILDTVLTTNEFEECKLISLLTNVVGVIYRTQKNPQLRDMFKYEIDYAEILNIIIGKQVFSIDENCGIYVDFTTANIIYINNGIKEKISF